MEASGSTPTPPPEGESTPADAPAPTTATEPAAPPPPPPPATDRVEDKPGVVWRVLGFVLFIVLAFACAVLAVVMVDLAAGPLCKDVAFTPLGPVEDCYDVSSAGRIASEIFGWPATILAGFGALLALAFTFTGRRGQLLLRVTGATVVLGAITLLVDQIG
jgi:hypothetical protein